MSAGRPLSGGVSGFPILHKAKYSGGYLYVVTIPDDAGNLYDYPEAALNEIRRTMSRDLDLYLEGPSKVSVFLYDNKTVIVENFNDTPVDVKLVGAENFAGLEDLETGEKIGAVKDAPNPFMRRRQPSARAAFSIKPHSYRAFRYE